MNGPFIGIKEVNEELAHGTPEASFKKVFSQYNFLPKTGFFYFCQTDKIFSTLLQFKFYWLLA